MPVRPLSESHMTLTRRSTLAVLGAASTLTAAPARAAQTKASPTRLWYRQPARAWVEALVVVYVREKQARLHLISTDRKLQCFLMPKPTPGHLPRWAFL